MKKKGFRSLLFICLGLIATIVFTSAVMMVSPPDPPGRPQAVDVQRDRCKIKYAAPRYDGGSSITGYIIERKYKSSDNWYKVSGKDNPTDLEYTIDGLVEGSEMQFRVRAVNAEGLSDPSKPSDMIMIEDPFVK
ncbi:MAG: fibronectin type III domain-containing protein [Butyricimonas faecalis]|jgi:hypothetical protein|uniref:Fibronectin type III domain-containing protein n=1 Tax=Butyricimonas faecalis TaxID=2093856 RepID=A0A3Q9IRM7_9BACT|nr:fibronectin type III domain-containing protein [Butyricimonas faecalis]AZS31284.1 fibronectin type III domain-containing protein [Butyricimonas faecalis]MBS7156101.1 fibronectin type III domain-containing protein [Sanguibacteroides justesenii]